MQSPEPTSQSVKSISAIELTFYCALIMLSTLLVANSVAILRAASFADEVGRECASQAAAFNDREEAKQAVDRVLKRQKLDGFFLREPYTCEILTYQNKLEAGKGGIATPFATVETSFIAWIPAPALFGGAFEKKKRALTMVPNLVKFTAIHSYPLVRLFDEEQKHSGKTSI